MLALAATANANPESPPDLFLDSGNTVSETVNKEFINYIKKEFPLGTPAENVKQEKQHVFYRYCVVLYLERNYQETMKCLDRIERSVLELGEAEVQYPAFLGGRIYHERPGAEQPIIPRVNFIRAEVYLELGDYRRALDALNMALRNYRVPNGPFKTYRFNATGAQIIPNLTSYSEVGNYEKVYGDLANRWSTISIVYWKNGLKEDTVKSVKVIHEVMANLGWLSKHGKAAVNLALTRSYMATGSFAEAMALADNDSYLSENAATLGLTAFHLMATFSGNPFSAFDAIGGVLYAAADPHGIGTRFQLAHVLIENGKYEKAKSLLEEVLSKSEAQLLPSIFWAILYDRGRISEKESKTDEAIRYYSQAIEEIERQRTSINTEGAKIGFFGDKQAVYQSLVRLLFQSGQHEQAFLMGERSKSRALVDMLANKQDFHVPSQDAQKVQQLLASAQVGEARLTRTAADKAAANYFAQRARKTDGAQTDVSADLGELRNLKRNAQEQLATQFSDLASLVSVPHVSLAEITQALPADETLVSYYYDAKNLYAYVIDKVGLKAVKLNREGLEAEVQALRQAIQKRGAYQPPAKALHDRLIAPLVDKLTSKKLLIAGHGVLHYLPFAALSNGQQFLVERYQLAFLPSASTLKFVGNIATQNKPGMLLAFGNPDLGDKQYDLAFAEKEAKEVGGLFGSSKVFLRKEASKQNLKEYGTGFRYLHFATHGKFEAANPLGSALLLASNSVDNLTDRLTIGELYSMRLDADLVTLSACETGLGDIANGDDVVGLVRGFLYAGANQVISTLWEIDDEATSHLMTNFYRQLKDGKTSKGAALRSSQLAAAKTYPHPYFWAAFQITGGAKEAKKL